MKKNGFTLIEILAVVVLLGLLALITITTINNTIKTNNNKAYDSQINSIILSAKTWSGLNVFNLPPENESIIITLGELKQAGLITDIINPHTDEPFNDNLQIKIMCKDNDYTYEIIE